MTTFLGVAEEQVCETRTKLSAGGPGLGKLEAPAFPALCDRKKRIPVQAGSSSVRLHSLRVRD